MDASAKDSVQSAIDWLSSHVLQLIEPSLHGVHIVGLSGSWLSSCWVCNLVCSSCNLATGLHCLLVAHLGEEFHDLAIVD